MWVKVSQSGRSAERKSGDGGASPFDRPSERRRKGPSKTARRVSRVSGSAQGHQGFHHHVRSASGSNLPDAGVGSQREVIRGFLGSGGRAAGVAGGGLWRQRGDREIGTRAIAG